MHRRPRSWLLGLLPTLAFLLTLLPVAAGAAPRLALVIGNATYPARPLATAANDAALVAQALAQAGFDVTAAHDLDGTAVRAAFKTFAEAARAAGPDATILVYLAGYGLQYDGGNYFVPVDARLVHDDDVPSQTADLGDLAQTLAAIPAKMRLLVYDLARALPFATADEMPFADGLAITSTPKDTLVAFNAAPGMVAPEDTVPYGAYARALAEMLGMPGLAPDAIFDRVRLRVGELTDGTQVPWDDGTTDATPIGGLAPDIAYSTVIAGDRLPGYVEFVRAFPDAPLTLRVRTLLAVRREALIWRAALTSDDPRAAWTYMRRYPRGPHRFDARRRLAALHAALEPPPRFDIVAFPDLPPPNPAELQLLVRPMAVLQMRPSIPPPPAALLQPANPDYHDALPPPAPAPPGLLPIAAPLRQAAPAPESGQITQLRPGNSVVVTLTQFASDGGATLTLADASGPVAELDDAIGPAGSRTLLETDATKAVLSRTTTVHAADGLTTIQTGANGGILYAITTRTEANGERTTRVSNGRGEELAVRRRNAQGIVVQHEVPGATAEIFSPDPTALPTQPLHMPTAAPNAIAPAMLPRSGPPERLRPPEPAKPSAAAQIAPPPPAKPPSAPTPVPSVSATPAPSSPPAVPTRPARSQPPSPTAAVPLPRPRPAIARRAPVPVTKHTAANHAAPKHTTPKHSPIKAPTRKRAAPPGKAAPRATPTRAAKPKPKAGRR